MVHLLLLSIISSWGISEVWILKNSQISYQVSHLFKTVEGVSTNEAKAKIQCHEKCEFLVGVPIKSFNSKNENRDLHMQDSMKAALHPITIIKGSINSVKDQKNNINVEVELAGIKKEYPANIQITQKGTKEIEVQGDLNIMLTDFSIERPSLLTSPINDKVELKFKLGFNLN